MNPQIGSDLIIISLKPSAVDCLIWGIWFDQSNPSHLMDQACETIVELLYVQLCSTIFNLYISPPARWGLLDFMLVDFRLPPSAFRLPSASSCSSSSARPQPRESTPSVPAGPQPRESTPSVPCRTSTARIHAQCSLPDLNRDHPRQVFPAGPQPRPSTPSVPCRASTATIHAKCSLPDLNRENPRPVFPAGPQPPERMPKDMPERMPDRMPVRMPEKNAR